MGSVKGVLLELEELKVENARLQEKVTEFEDAYLLLNPHSMERPDPGTVKINLEMFLSEYESLRAYKAECSGRELDPYDAGYLNDFGGGNVGWWHDYIRSELDRAHDHYASQVTIPSDRVADKPAADGEGCICQSCENHYKADLLVPDGVWEQIKPEGKPAGSGLLCPSCIMGRIIEQNIWTAGRAEDSDKPPSRITEQDALTLVGSAMHHYIFNDHNVNIDDWFESEGRALLDKLNADREPAVSVPDEVRNILERISRWHGEFPPTGKFWDDDKTRPISYGAEYGSNGERDYMRGLAEQALAMLSASPVDSEGE